MFVLWNLLVVTIWCYMTNAALICVSLVRSLCRMPMFHERLLPLLLKTSAKGCWLDSVGFETWGQREASLLIFRWLCLKIGSVKIPRFLRPYHVSVWNWYNYQMFTIFIIAFSCYINEKTTLKGRGSVVVLGAHSDLFKGQVPHDLHTNPGCRVWSRFSGPWKPPAKLDPERIQKDQENQAAAGGNLKRRFPKT